MIIIISIEGNIGSGKSTFLDILRKQFKYHHFNIEYVDEPLDLWLKMKDDNNVNLLDNFYKDQERWSYTFQNFAFISHKKYLENAFNSLIKKEQDKELKYIDGIIICERSTLTDKYVFGKQLYQDGKINKMEWQIYEEWFNWLENKFDNLKIDYHIYVRTSPEICQERIKKRNRDEETTIPLEYLEKIHNRHDEWLRSTSYNDKVLEIDSTDGYFDNPEKIKMIISNIQNFITDIYLG
jgi:deoxyadenosine/deoxycytidine kinase